MLQVAKCMQLILGNTRIVLEKSMVTDASWYWIKNGPCEQLRMKWSITDGKVPSGPRLSNRAVTLQLDDKVRR